MISKHLYKVLSPTASRPMGQLYRINDCVWVRVKLQLKQRGVDLFRRWCNIITSHPIIGLTRWWPIYRVVICVCWKLAMEKRKRWKTTGENSFQGFAMLFNRVCFFRYLFAYNYVVINKAYSPKESNEPLYNFCKIHYKHVRFNYNWKNPLDNVWVIPLKCN